MVVTEVVVTEVVVTEVVVMEEGMVTEEGMVMEEGMAAVGIATAEVDGGDGPIGMIPPS